MARIRGVYLRKPPEVLSPALKMKRAALSASPTMLIADAGFPKDKNISARNAAFRVNRGSRNEWPASEFFAIWDYAEDLVLRRTHDDAENGDGVEVVGFVRGDTVYGDDGKSAGSLKSLQKEKNVEVGGWLLLIGARPNIPKEWEEVVNAPGSRKRGKAAK